MLIEKDKRFQTVQIFNQDEKLKSVVVLRHCPHQPIHPLTAIDSNSDAV